MIDLQFRNFRALRSAELIDPGKISVILGYNEAGKSSVCGGIEYAWTGAAFGCKGKEVSKLVTWGQGRMKVGVRCGGKEVSRTLTSGPAIKDIASEFGVEVAALPLLFNPKFGAQGGGKAMSAFLALRENESFDIRALFSTEPKLTALLDEVFAAAKTSAPKDVASAAEGLRAKCQPLSVPREPEYSRPEPDACEKVASFLPAISEIESLEQKVTRAKSLVAYLTRLDEYTAQASQKEDSLGIRRAALRECAELETKPVSRVADILRAAGFEAASEHLEASLEMIAESIAGATGILADNPAPAALGRLPVLSDETAAFRDSLREPTIEAAKEFIEVTQVNISKMSRKLPEYAKTRELATSTISDIQNKMAVWDAYISDAAKHAERSAATADRWASFDAISRTIKETISARKAHAARDFLENVTAYAAPILNGRELTLSSDNEICLGGAEIDLLSESTKWRLLAAVMAAIAKAAKSPLLVLDGMDILDSQNKPTVMKFVMKQMAPDFEHILLLSTLKGTEADEKPIEIPGITKWLLRDGQFQAVV